MSGKNLKIAFFGTPELVITILDELEKNDLSPSIIVTGEDMPKGRKLAITPPAPKAWAQERNIPAWQPKKLDEEFINNFKSENFDLSVVVAYGKILPEALINAPKHGTINVHYSLLPKYRGATPVESALLNDEKETGVSIQRMVFKLDAGDIVAEERVAIKENETAPELRARLNEIAKAMLPKAILDILDGRAKYESQDESLSTHCKKINKEDVEINLSDDPYKNYLKIRAYMGYGPYFFQNVGEKKIRLKIKKVSFKNNLLAIESVVPEGKKEMSYEDFKRGLI